MRTIPINSTPSNIITAVEEDDLQLHLFHPAARPSKCLWDSKAQRLVTALLVVTARALVFRALDALYLDLRKRRMY